MQGSSLQQRLMACCLQHVSLMHTPVRHSSRCRFRHGSDCTSTGRSRGQPPAHSGGAGQHGTSAKPAHRGRQQGWAHALTMQQAVRVAARAAARLRQMAQHSSTPNSFFRSLPLFVSSASSPLRTTCPLAAVRLLYKPLPCHDPSPGCTPPSPPSMPLIPRTTVSSCCCSPSMRCSHAPCVLSPLLLLLTGCTVGLHAGFSVHLLPLRQQVCDFTSRTLAHNPFAAAHAGVVGAALAAAAAGRSPVRARCRPRAHENNET